MNKTQVPGWVWLFTGTALGAFIMFLMRLSEIEPSQPGQSKTKINEPTSKVVTQEQKPRFDFYNVLKENKVPIPNVEPAQKETTKPADTSAYVLQVASFKNAADAEELKVKLILLNLEAKSETVTVRNGEKWHRVLVGPYTSRSKLASARSTLVSNNYEALVLKRKPE